MLTLQLFDRPVGIGSLKQLQPVRRRLEIFGVQPQFRWWLRVDSTPRRFAGRTPGGGGVGIEEQRSQRGIAILRSQQWKQACRYALVQSATCIMVSREIGSPKSLSSAALWLAIQYCAKRSTAT